LIGVGTTNVSVVEGQIYTLQICVSDTAVNMSGAEVALATSTIEAGLGTGDVTNEMVFQSFRVSRHAEETRPECPSCASSCLIFSDDFSCDNTSIDWDINAGSWFVSSSGYLGTASSNALIICNATYPDATGVFHPHVIQVTMKAVTGSRSRVIFSYDAGTYNYLEVYWNGSASYCYIKTSGGSTVATSAVQNFANGTWYIFVVCVTETSAVVDINATWPFATLTEIENTTNIVGLGASASGLQFKDFSISKHGVEAEGCPKCEAPCSVSSTNKASPWLKVAVSGVTEKTRVTWVYPIYCSCANGSFYLPENGTCRWQKADCSHISPTYAITATAASLGGHYVLTLTFQVGNSVGGEAGATFTHDFGTEKPDLTSLVDIPCSFVSNDTNSVCYYNSATVIITSIDSVSDTDLDDGNTSFCSDCTQAPSSYSLTFSTDGATYVVIQSGTFCYFFASTNNYVNLHWTRPLPPNFNNVTVSGQYGNFIGTMNCDDDLVVLNGMAGNGTVTVRKL